MVPQNQQWKEYIDAAMKACNGRTTSNAQKVGKWGLIPTDFSVDGECISSTLISRSCAKEANARGEHIIPFPDPSINMMHLNQNVGIAKVIYSRLPSRSHL